MSAKRKLPPDQILKAMALSGANYAAIAREYGVSVSAVRLHVRRLGVPPRPHISVQRKLPPDEDFKAIVTAGFSTKSIAERFECSPASVSRMKRELGLPMWKTGRRKGNGAAPASRYFG